MESEINTLICSSRSKNVQRRVLKIPPSNVVCTYSVALSVACTPLLKGMIRFVFVSRFSIAAGLASAVAGVHLFSKYVSVCANGCTHCSWTLHACHPLIQPKPCIIQFRAAQNSRSWEEERQWQTAQAEMSGAVCKKRWCFFVCMMRDKGTSGTKVSASLHSGAAARRRHCLPTARR